VVGHENQVLARIEAVASVSSDTTDFWRRDGAQYPSVVGKFSVDEGYFAHSERVVRMLFEATSTGPDDFSYCVFHQPLCRIAVGACEVTRLFCGPIETRLTAARIGNTYSASCLLALAAVLEQAKPGERILLVSFGSGAGSDGLVLQVTDRIDGYRKRRNEARLDAIETELGQEHADWLTYGQYARDRES